MAGISILTGKPLTAAQVAPQRVGISTVFASIAAALQEQTVNTAKLATTLGGLKFYQDGPVELSEQALEKIKSFSGSIAAATAELGVQVFALRQAVGTMPAPADVEPMKLQLTQLGEFLSTRADAILAEVASLHAAMPKTVPVPALVSPGPGFNEVQLRKILAPVSLTVEVERRFDGRIERFIVNET